MDVLSASADALSSGSVPEYKHFPIADSGIRRRHSRNYIIRAAAKRYSQSAASASSLAAATSHLPTRDDAAAAAAADAAPSSKNALRPFLEGRLREALLYDGNNHLVRRLGGPKPSTFAPRKPHVGDADEGRDLARSGVPLPSDSARSPRQHVRRRCPSLERQDAFCDADTFKGHNVRLRQYPGAGFVGTGSNGDARAADDAQVAELYSMGLLYDDKDVAEAQARKSFDLNSIRHDEPIYAMRPAKRTRRAGIALRGKAGASSKAAVNPLGLELSFTNLESDEAIAPYLASPTSETCSASGCGGSSASRSSKKGTPSASRGRTPMRVVYELAGGGTRGASYDVETSQQPHDLVADDDAAMLSDYDYFSDADVDDTPLQREVVEPPAEAGRGGRGGDTWVMLG